MSRRCICMAIACALVVTTTSRASAQLPPRDVAPNAGPATGVIRGVVTAADTGLPLRGAEIRLSGNDLPSLRPRGAIADAEGRYEIDALSPGQYTITASKPGYVALAYGQTRVVDTGRVIDVRASATVDTIDIALPRGAVIVVHVADEFGDPIAGYRGTAFQPRFVDGRRTLRAIGGDIQYVTDDRGEIRLSGLAPGEYYVAVSPPGSGSVSTSPRGKEPQTFYPGTASETDALPVTVGLGEEISIAFPLASARAARISGVIEGFTGRPPEVRLERRTQGNTMMLSVNLTPEGRFSAANLVPADYVLTARGETGSGVLRFRVDGEDLEGLVLTMQPQQPLRGRVAFDGKPPAGLPPSAIVLRPVVTEGGSLLLPIAQFKTDWSFEIPGLIGTGVLRGEQLPRDWFVQAVVLDGVDVTDTALDFNTFAGKSLEVRLTQRVPRITGAVIDDAGRRRSEYVAVIFPEDRQLWTPYSRAIAAARPDQQGRFLVQGLPPGRYLVTAVDYLEPGAERSAATLERLRRSATSIVLTVDESKTVELRVVP
jgi:hypothetical protein